MSDLVVKTRRVIIDSNNDIGTPTSLIDGACRCNKPDINIFDLSFNSQLVGYQANDYTDIIDEDGYIESLLIEVHRNGDDSAKERYVVNLGDTWKFFAVNDTQRACGVRGVNCFFKASFDASIRQTNGEPSKLIARSYLGDDSLIVPIRFDAVLNVKTGNITGHGSAEPAHAMGNRNIVPVAASSLVFHIIGFTPHLCFNAQELTKLSR